MNWEGVCKEKKEGGLGIKNINDLNTALPAKWAWKFFKGPEAPWRNQISNAHYSKRKFGFRVRRTFTTICPIWRDISRNIKAFWTCASFNLGDGEKK